MPRDGSFLVATLQGMARPPDLYRFGADFSSRDRLTTIEPRLEGRAIGAAESFETVVPLHDGRLKAVRTAVLLPRGPGAATGCRPSSRSTAATTCRGWQRDYGGGDVATMPAPIFTSRGFAVLLVDAPLGPEGRPGQPLDELRDAVLPQVYRAAELGYIDIGRVALAGQSYGGYCTAGLVSTTNLFRAAVAVDGSYDLGGKYGILRPGDDGRRVRREGAGAHGPTPVERPETLPRQLTVLPGRPDPHAPADHPRPGGPRLPRDARPR